jgi:hypothetical protein
MTSVFNFHEINIQTKRLPSLEFRAMKFKGWWGHDICLTIDGNVPHAKI